MKKIGIFAQRREYAGRLFNNLSFDYISAIESTSVIALIIPVFTPNLDAYISMCDAFIFPGGPDIDPTLYNQSVSWARGIVPGYDRFLLSAMNKIFEVSKPILGICKGMQLLNVACGGTLNQDIEENVYHFQPERWYEKIDTISILHAESFLWKIYKNKTLKVNSIHHQSVWVLWKDLRVVARSAYDDEIEAIEHNSLPYYWVQWHPEYFKSDKLFKWFIKSILK